MSNTDPFGLTRYCIVCCLCVKLEELCRTSELWTKLHSKSDLGFKEQMLNKCCVLAAVMATAWCSQVGCNSVMSYRNRPRDVVRFCLLRPTSRLPAGMITVLVFVSAAVLGLCTAVCLITVTTTCAGARCRNGGPLPLCCLFSPSFLS